jgi:xylose dehydrogenase (NAD/NADP)
VTPVRWGLLGAGFIASRGVAPAMRAADGVVVQAVAARDIARAEALEPVRALDSYDELCSADDVDAVYISLPNDAHLHWVTVALEAGKAVLCEKPLALDAAQVAEMTAVAERTGGLLVEASWNRWHPRTRRVEQVLADVDRPVDVLTWFTFPGVPEDNYRLDPSRGGGALLDVGCYATAAALIALGEDAVVVDAEQHMGATGVDLTTAATLQSALGRAHVLGSFEQEEAQGWTVTTEGFALSLDHPAFTSWHEASTLRIAEDGVERVETFDAVDPYRLMVEAVSRRVRGEDAWGLPLSTSYAVARVLDDIVATAVRT